MKLNMKFKAGLSLALITIAAYAVPTFVVMVVASGLFTNLCQAQGIQKSIELHYGYISKLECEGKLLISAIGNQELVKLDALPEAVGCGVLLKPLQKTGATNLVLETSTSSIEISIHVLNSAPRPGTLVVYLKESRK